MYFKNVSNTSIHLLIYIDGILINLHVDQSDEILIGSFVYELSLH